MIKRSNLFRRYLISRHFGTKPIFKHKLFKNVLVYTYFGVIRSAIPFLLLPILTRYLTPSDYGIVATFQVILAVMIVFVGLNAYGAVAVNFFKLNKDELKIYIFNVIFIILISFISTLFIIYILRNTLSNLTKFPGNWLPIIVVIAFSQSFITLVLTLWQVEQKPLPYGLFQITQMITNMGLSLFFIIVLNWRWQGRLLGIIIASSVFALIGIFVLFKRNYVTFSLDKIYIKDSLFFGIPLIPHALGGWIMTGIDRIFINSMVSIAATGIYTVGYQVGMIIGLLTDSFNRAYAPFLYEKLKENNRSTKIKLVKFTYSYFIGIILLALILSFFAPLFLKFFVGKNFYFAYKYVLWIALGYAAGGMYYMVVNYIFYVKKTYILAWITFSSAILNIILNYLLIKANGPVGAAQATTITFFISFIFTWILSAKVYKMPWRIWKS